MTREFFINLVNRAKKAAHAIKAQLSALAHKLLPSNPQDKFPVPSISPETGKAMDMGRRYRLTSDHSPVFSLFTFSLTDGKRRCQPPLGHHMRHRTSHCTGAYQWYPVLCPLDQESRTWLRDYWRFPEVHSVGVKGIV